MMHVVRPRLPQVLDTIATRPCGAGLYYGRGPFPHSCNLSPCLRASPCVDPAALSLSASTAKGGRSSSHSTLLKVHQGRRPSSARFSVTVPARYFYIWVDGNLIHRG